MGKLVQAYNETEAKKILKKLCNSEMMAGVHWYDFSPNDDNMSTIKADGSIANWITIIKNHVIGEMDLNIYDDDQIDDETQFFDAIISWVEDQEQENYIK